MKRYEVIPYEPAHFDALAFDKESFALTLGKPAPELARIYKDKGPAYTGFFLGMPIVIAGVAILWPGCGEAWAILGKDAYRHGFFIHRRVVRELARIAKEHRMTRIQACADKGNRAATTWLHALKFDYEGEMPFYFGGKTFCRFAKIFSGV